MTCLPLFSQPAPPVHPVVPAAPQPVAPTQNSSGGSLDSMLGLLQSDLSRQGVQTSSKGNCSACQKPVVGQVSHQNDMPFCGCSHNCGSLFASLVKTRPSGPFPDCQFLSINIFFDLFGISQITTSDNWARNVAVK